MNDLTLMENPDRDPAAPCQGAVGGKGGGWTSGEGDEGEGEVNLRRDGDVVLGEGGVALLQLPVLNLDLQRLRSNRLDGAGATAREGGGTGRRAPWSSLGA